MAAKPSKPPTVEAILSSTPSPDAKERTEPFPARSLTLKPEQLVEGWPADKWADYKHSERPEQVLAGIATAMGWLREWLDGGRKDFPGVGIYGPIGVGKSGGVLLLALEAARRGCSVQFETVETILAEFNSTTPTQERGERFQYAEEHQTDVLNRWLAPTLLVMDELCARFYSDKERAFLLNVIRRRQSMGKLTPWTSNLLLNTAAGEETFVAFFDGRALSTFKGWRVDAGKWGPSLRGRDDGNKGDG